MHRNACTTGHAPQPAHRASCGTGLQAVEWDRACGQPPRPGARRQALTSRPLLLAAVGRATNSSNQTTLYLTPMRVEAGLIKTMIGNVHAAIQHINAAAQQLPKLDRWRVLLACICQRIVGQIGLPTSPPTLAAPGWLLFSGLLMSAPRPTTYVVRPPQGGRSEVTKRPSDQVSK